MSIQPTFKQRLDELEKAFLTQSGQLYSEATCASLGKVYCFGPVFRAEKSKTRRHLTEFWMVEPEMAYADLEDVKALGEQLIVHVIGRVLEHRAEDLKILERDVSKLESIKLPFPLMSYDDAVKKLQAKGSEIQWGSDFGNTDETLLTEDQDRPVIVNDQKPGTRILHTIPSGRRTACAGSFRRAEAEAGSARPHTGRGQRSKGLYRRRLAAGLAFSVRKIGRAGAR